MNTLYIMQGIPGSGKSYLARKLAEKHDGVICSADDFFLKNGKYKYDPRLVGVAHQWCLGKAEEAFKFGSKSVIIDNTNTLKAHYKPYVKLAEKYGYEVEVVRARDITPTESAEKNIHGVPLEVCEQLYEQLQSGT